MSDIVKYEILNPTSSNKKPYYDDKKELFIFPTNENYTHYIEAVQNGEDGGRHYFLLLGKEKFNPNARKCVVDQYGKCKIKVRGEVKEYIVSECKSRGNIELLYDESADTYDVYRLR